MATVKDLASGIRRFCTQLDVVNQFPKVVTDQINMDQSDSPIVRYEYQLDTFIRDASNIVSTALRPIYTSDSNLEASAPYIGAIVSDLQNDDPTARLLGAEAGSSAITEMFTVEFTSATAYTVTGFLSGGVGSGTITTDFTGSGDGDIKIRAATYSGLWSGTFASGDKVFVSVEKYDSIIVTITAKLAAAMALDSIFLGEFPNDSGIVQKLRNSASAYLKRLQRPEDPDGYALSTLPTRDLSDIQVTGDPDDWLDPFGNEDESHVADDDYSSYTA